MTQKFLGHPLLVFYPLQTTRKVLIDRNHAGSSKARSAQGASQFAACYAAVRL